jgi:hypothetical protein
MNDELTHDVAELLVAHSRRNVGGLCLCGHQCRLGTSFAVHQAEEVLAMLGAGEKWTGYERVEYISVLPNGREYDHADSRERLIEKERLHRENSLGVYVDCLAQGVEPTFEPPAQAVEIIHRVIYVDTRIRSVEWREPWPDDQAANDV